MDFTFLHSCRDGEIAPPSDHYAAIGRSPVPVWNEALNGWAVTDYSGVKSVLTRVKEFHNGDSPQRSAFGHDAMLFQDGGLHNRMRSTWATELLPAGIARRKAQLDALAARRTSPLRDQLTSGERVDLVPVFQDFTTDVITAFMDVPDDRRTDFQRWNTIMTSTSQLALKDGDPRFAERVQAKRETYRYLEEQMADRETRFARGETPSDLVALMVASQATHGIRQSAVADNLLNLFIGALDTTVRWMGNIVTVLLQHRDVLAEVVDSPELAPLAVEEVLRYRSVVQVTTRHTAMDGAEIEGVRLDPGSLVYVLPGMANWDPAAFPDPACFDIHRQEKGQKDHLGFGFGMHQCLGMHTARAEVLAFFRPLFRSMCDWDIVEADYGDSWTLWGPTHLHVVAR